VCVTLNSPAALPPGKEPLCPLNRRRGRVKIYTTCIQQQVVEIFLLEPHHSVGVLELSSTAYQPLFTCNSQATEQTRHAIRYNAALSDVPAWYSIFIVEQSLVTAYGQNTKHVPYTSQQARQQYCIASCLIQRYCHLQHPALPLNAGRSQAAAHLRELRGELPYRTLSDAALNSSTGLRFRSPMTPPMELSFCHVIPSMIPLLIPTNQLPQLETLLARSLLRLFTLAIKMAPIRRKSTDTVER
jgi:hypothetical protein